MYMKELVPSILAEIIRQYFETELKIPRDEIEDWFIKNAEKAEGLQSGSHVAKGIHSSSKASNIVFKPDAELEGQDLGLIGTHSLKDIILDVSGNGALITLMRVVAMPVQERYLYDLLIEDHPALDGVFSKDPEKSKAIQKALKSVYLTPEKLESDELLKQIIWPLDESRSIGADHYRNLIPLHASSFIYEANLRIRERYSDEQKKAREARRDWRKIESGEQVVKPEVKAEKLAGLTSYANFKDLARVKLGGAHPRNVGLHTHNLFGRNHLLPSFPPSTSLGNAFFLHKDAKTIFDQRLAYHCENGFRELSTAMKRIQYQESKNINMAIAEHFRLALDEIFYSILQVMSAYRALPAGWSDAYELKAIEKNWLDPNREKNAGKALTRESIEHLAASIKDWVVKTQQKNRELQSILEGKGEAMLFADREYESWLKMLKATLFDSLSETASAVDKEDHNV